MSGSRCRLGKAPVRLARAAALAAAMAATAPIAAVQFQVNSYTTGNQYYSVVAMSPSSAFAVVWSSNGQDGNSRGLFARRFASDGTALGTEFLVNSMTAGQQEQPSVAMEDDGDFVIAWSSNPLDGNSFGVAARRFDSNGTALAAELQVNSYTTGVQRIPAIAVDAEGDFVIVWNSDGQDGYFEGVFGQRFDSAGAKLGGEFQVPTYTAFREVSAVVAMRDNGGFAVAWSSARDGDSLGVFARGFTSAGVAVGGELQINTYTTSGQGRPSVAVDDNGALVVTWESYGQDGAGLGIFGRRVGPAGALLGAEFQVNERTVDSQATSRVARTGAGDFVVVWQSFAQDGSGYGVFGRRFDQSAIPAEGEFQINSLTEESERGAALGIDGAGGFVVAWSFGDDGDGSGVFAARFPKTATLDVDADGSIGPLTDGVLLLRFMFGFTGPTLVVGAVGPNCTRCEAGAITAYLESLV